MADGRKIPRFYRQGNDWFYSSPLPSDFVINVDGTHFHLHQFPLVSKCGKIAHLLEGSSHPYADLSGCPGGSDAFLIATRFCYGLQVDMTPRNIILVYCISDYLEMTEKYGEENLSAKSESFLHRFILQNWNDCILALQNADSSLKWVGSICITSKLLHSLSTMVCTDMNLLGWPMRMYGSMQSPGGSILWNGISTGVRISSSHSDWWFEDVSSLNMYLFERLIESLKIRAVRTEALACAVVHYAKKHIPGLTYRQNVRKAGISNIMLPQHISTDIEQRFLIESIDRILPMQKGKSFCSFLLRLLRIAMIVGVSDSCLFSLEKRVGFQLELAVLNDLLLPDCSNSCNLYHTDSVERITRHFLLADKDRPLRSLASPDRGPPLKAVGWLMDSYLAEVTPDANLKPDTLYCLAAILPEASRVVDDGLYRALDIYFKVHPQLLEEEKERLCSVINCHKLSFDACAHALQNELLPRRFILRVLFFEQLHMKNAIACHIGQDRAALVPASNLESQIISRDGWAAVVRNYRRLRMDLENMKPRLWELEHELASIKQAIRELVAKVNKATYFSPRFASWMIRSK